MTELVTTNGKSIAQLAQELGATMGQTNGGNNASRMSELKINSSPDDDAGNPTPRGHFFIKGEDTPAFAPDVTLRVLTHHFQYLNYDNVAKKLVSKSKIIQHFDHQQWPGGSDRKITQNFQQKLLLLVSPRDSHYNPPALWGGTRYGFSHRKNLRICL